ncbi:hypothetical protein KAU39_02860 [bacterium]|nr:hypothetical protein [bacterium]
MKVYSKIVQRSFKYIIFLPLIFIVGCELNPLNKLTNPTLDESLGNTSWNDWVVYDDDLKGVGGTIYMTGPQGQNMDFRVTGQSPPQGDMCMKYSWTGEDVYDYEWNIMHHGYCYLSLIVDEDSQSFGSTYRDFTPGGYTKITFWAKGALSADTTVVFTGPHGEEVVVNNLTNTWKQHEITLTQLTSITAYFTIGFNYSGGDDIPGVGGFVYVDDIRYVK